MHRAFDTRASDYERKLALYPPKYYTSIRTPLLHTVGLRCAHSRVLIIGNHISNLNQKTASTRTRSQLKCCNRALLIHEYYGTYVSNVSSDRFRVFASKPSFAISATPNEESSDELRNIAMLCLLKLEGTFASGNGPY